MNLKPVKLPPGAYRQGTDYSSVGRWFDVNLIRWDDHVVKPVGGWEVRQDNTGTDIDSYISNPSTETARDMVSYTDNSGNNLIVIGTNSALYYVSEGGIVTDITPAGFVGTSNGVGNLIGYGVGPYGAGTYGTPRSASSSVFDPVDRWSFDNWGEDVLGLWEADGNLYRIQPGAIQATDIAAAPADLVDFVVTDERIVMAIRNSPDVREVVWCDREDYNDWTPSVTNYAGSYPLQGVGKAIGIYTTLGQILVLTSSVAYSATYLGAPLVYGFQRVGERCAPVSRHAVVSADRFIMWLGARNFWYFDGTLSQIDCEIMEYIFDDLDPVMVSKMFTMTIAEHTEVWWFYQCKTGTEVDSYIHTTT